MKFDVYGKIKIEHHGSHRKKKMIQVDKEEDKPRG